MDAFTQQMLMMQLNSRTNQAMGQPSMYSYYPHSTDAATSTRWVQPYIYTSHHGASTPSPHGHTVHPVHQQYHHSTGRPTVNPVHQQYQHYGPYSLQYSPPHTQRVRGSHHPNLHPPQAHQSWNHHPVAQSWDLVVKVPKTPTAQRTRGHDGSHGKSRRSPAHPPPSRDSRRRSSGKRSAPKVPGGSKHRSHRKSRCEVDNGWSTTAQRGCNHDCC